MSRDTSNDNETPAIGDGDAPDPHGMAALLLVESLIHGLIARSAITTAEAVDVVTVAAEVEAVMISDGRHAAEASKTSAGLLEAIARSLSQDIVPGRE